MSRSRFSVSGRLAVVAAVAGLVAVACSSSKKSSTTSTGATPTSGVSATSGAPTTSEVVVKSSRGYDGTTIKVAGIAGLANFAGAEIGAQARFKRANDTNELNGIKIQFLEFADDKQDPATATSEVRRLVTQSQVFAIVPDLSAVNPGPYLADQHVPYVGYAFDNTYCSTTPSTSIWGFGYDGCLVPADPPVMPDGLSSMYKYVSGKTGKASPSIVIFSADNQSGKNTARFQASAAEGAGFNVVAAKGIVPVVTSDYSPYVQQWINADGGKQPDVIDCLIAAQCIPIWQAFKAAGYKGIYYHTLGAVDALAKAMAGTVTAAFYNTDTNPALTQLQADLEAFKPGTKPVGYANVPAYFAADMFIQALKKVGRNITPEAVQKALANQTWQIQGLVGPIKYPDSTVAPTPACNEVLQDSADGSGYTVLEPYACYDKQFKINPKFQG
jgi:ABC-type branched-subunit amino acid transport system substrate-binding protein